MDYQALRIQLNNQLHLEHTYQTIDESKIKAINRLMLVIASAEDINKLITHEIVNPANAMQGIFNCIQNNHNYIVELLSNDVIENTPDIINLSDFYAILASAQTYVQLAKSEGNANAANIVLN